MASRSPLVTVTKSKDLNQGSFAMTESLYPLASVAAKFSSIGLPCRERFRRTFNLRWQFGTADTASHAVDCDTVVVKAVYDSGHPKRTSEVLCGHASKARGIAS